jgi:hypothetical protein
MGGSPTAETLGAASRVGTVDDAYAFTRVIASGGTDVPAAIQLLKKFIPTKSNNLNEAQMQEVAELLVSTDKQLLRNALTNNEARDALINTINNIADRLIAGGARATVQQVTDLVPNATSIVSPSFAEEIDPDDYKVIEDLSSSISPSTRQKILGLNT